jgi:hypothetical protein
MANPFSNRKKVRGWKRRLRELERFRLHHRELDAEALPGEGVHYVKVWLDPWSRLEKRNPPLWFRRRIVAALLDIHDAWREALERRGEPYYLSVWLFHPDFHRSQVVAALGDDTIAYYRGVFEPAPDAPPRPPALYDDRAYDLDRLQWTAGTEINASYGSSAWDGEELQEWLRSADRVEPTADGSDTLFIWELGKVWASAPGPG